MRPNARFFPVVVASSFVDYWNYSFSGIRPDAEAAHNVNGRPLTQGLLKLSRGSMLGGTLVSAASVLAWLACVRFGVRHRRWDVVGLLLVPMLTIVATLQFAIQYPFDLLGVVKGSYLQFGLPPLIAMFGVAVDWARRRPARWPLCAVMLLSLGLVALYTLACRTGVGVGVT